MICWDDLEKKIVPHFSDMDKKMYDRAKERYPLLAKAFLVTEVITKYEFEGRPSDEFISHARDLVNEIREANQDSEPFLADQISRLLETMEQYLLRLEKRRMLN